MLCCTIMKRKTKKKNTVINITKKTLQMPGQDLDVWKERKKVSTECFCLHSIGEPEKNIGLDNLMKNASVYFLLKWSMKLSARIWNKVVMTMVPSPSDLYAHEVLSRRKEPVWMPIKQNEQLPTEREMVLPITMEPH